MNLQSLLSQELSKMPFVNVSGEHTMMGKNFSISFKMQGPECICGTYMDIKGHKDIIFFDNMPSYERIIVESALNWARTYIQASLTK